MKKFLRRIVPYVAEVGAVALYALGCLWFLALLSIPIAIAVIAWRYAMGFIS